MKVVGGSGGRKQENGLKVIREKHFSENNLPIDEKSCRGIRSQRSEVRERRAGLMIPDWFVSYYCRTLSALLHTNAH